MPNLYKGYCYATITDTANAIQSEPTMVYSTGAAQVNSYTVAGNVVTLTYGYKPFSTTAAATTTQTKTLPTCANVGYLTNYSGLDLVDAVTVSWLVLLVWAMAWGIKAMRRGL
jgi:hypothetical protein